MKADAKRQSMLWRLCIAVLIVLTCIGFWKSIFISLDIDESYAVAQAYRLANGDKLLVDMWEPHQFSAYLAAIFVKLYITIFGRVEYLVIFLRIVGILIHLCLGGLLFDGLKRVQVNERLAVLVTFLHLNFLPKWVQMPEFELMHYWGMELIAICMLFYFSGKKKGIYPVLAGISLVGCMLCYPTMLLLYPAYVLGWIVPEHSVYGNRGKGALKSALLFTLGSLCSGLFFLATLFAYQTPGELFDNLSNIFMDKSHTTYTMQEKWSLYGSQMMEQIKVYPKYLLLGLAGVVLLWVLGHWINRKDTEKNSIILRLEAFAISVFVLAGVSMQLKSVWGMLTADRNQFYFQVRYVALLLPGLYLGIRYHRQMALWFYSMVLPALISLPAVLLITNMDTNTSYAKMFLGVLGSILICEKYFTQILNCDEKRSTFVWKSINACVMTALFLGLFVCRLLLIRVTGCLPVTVRADLNKMEYGAEKGVYVLADTARIWNENYEVLESEVRPEDRLLYVGAENLIYLKVGCEIASPSTQGTNVYNEMFLHYFELHPEKWPTIIVLDKTYETNPVYGNYFGSEPLLEWIEEYYGTATRMETDYMTVLLTEGQ